jgi:hypothetical protein
VRVDDPELITFGQQIGLMDIEQDVEMSGTLWVIFQIPEVVNNVWQSDRTGTARSNQLSGLVDVVRHRHFTQLQQNHGTRGVLSAMAIYRQLSQR